MTLPLSDTAGMTGRTNRPTVPSESRQMRDFQDFLRASRRYLDGPLVAAISADYDRLCAERGVGRPQSEIEARPVVDRLIPFQLYQWMYRHLQQFKYSRNDLGIVAACARDRDALTAALARAEARAPERLRLDPTLAMPDYYTAVDFHQQPGGVWSDALGGFIYEMGRRTTVPQHMDPAAVYRILFDALPQDRHFERVLDWGTGTGAGLIAWKMLHPESEGHGVDLAAPCLRLAHLRALEAGLDLTFALPYCAALLFGSATFGLILHMFTLHEIPPTDLPAVLREAARVLKPGGIMAGPEFHLTPGDPLFNVIQRSHAWTNNETYSACWFDFDIEGAAWDAGFSKVTVSPFTEHMSGGGRPGTEGRPRTGLWNLYVFEK